MPASSETKRTTAAGFALLGYHIAAGRAAIEVVGGLGLLNTDVTTSHDVRIARGLGLAPTRQESTSSTFDAVAVVGADVAVSLTTHAAIVPHVRAYARSGGLSVRPGLALRWTFLRRQAAASPCYPRPQSGSRVPAVPIFEYSCNACRHEFETLVRTGDTPACPKCAGTALSKLLSLPAIKSESTHGLAMRAAHRRDKVQQSDKNREQREYELNHDD